MTVSIVSPSGKNRTVFNVRAIHELEDGFELSMEFSDNSIKVTEENKLIVSK